MSPARVIRFAPRPRRPALVLEPIHIPWWARASIEQWVAAAVLLTLAVAVGVQIGIRQGRELERLEHPVAVVSER